MIQTYHKHSERLLQQLPKGVFITAKGQDVTNTMTIAWGHIGVLWGKPIFIAYVRYSRYTYDVLQNAADFTINVPTHRDLSEALRLAGTHSGRLMNKYKEANLTLIPAEKTQTPIIAECGLNYECKIVYRQTMEPALIPDDIKPRYYPKHDTHIMFFGEIVNISFDES